MAFPPHQPNGPIDARPRLAITLIVIAVAVFGTCSAIGIYGIRKFNRDVKDAEAKYTLGEIARAAEVAYERDGKLCASSSAPVPAKMSAVAGKKYQSSSRDWIADRAEY
jgi:hypothetical protein